MGMFVWTSKENCSITLTSLKNLIDKVGLDEFKEYVECVFDEDYDMLNHYKKVHYMLDYYEDDEYATLKYFKDCKEAFKYVDNYMNKRDEIIARKLLTSL